MTFGRTTKSGQFIAELAVLAFGLAILFLFLLTPVTELLRKPNSMLKSFRHGRSGFFDEQRSVVGDVNLE